MRYLNYCKQKGFLLLLGSLLVVMSPFSGPAFGKNQSKPDFQPKEWMYHSLVDVEFVQQHVKIPVPEDVMIVDARPYKPKYIKGHIPGAVSVPNTTFEEHAGKLPKDKDTLLIFYCGGLKCKLSHKAARKAEELGYTNIKVFAEGFPRWMKVPGHYASISAEYVAAQMAENAVMVYDARPFKPKYVKGHVPGAISLPNTQFDSLSAKLPRDTDFPVIFYCGGLECRLSHKAARKAMELGYTDVKVLSGGYPEWKAAYGSDPSTAVAVKAGEIEGSIEIAQFKKIMENNPESILLIDVRDSDEFAKGSFETSVNIPVDDLEKKVDELPEDKPIVFVCSTGARSGESYYMLQDLRPSLEEVYYLEGGLEFKEDGSYTIEPTS
ncbi:MAG: rhodanese-like domain-containing protein [Desulfohalobiaceae bacterium]|nr:rhodanese-like domain-containing protein [Desulfohalobiaceae bacterium]